MQAAVGHSCCYYNAKETLIFAASTNAQLDHVADPNTAVVVSGEAEVHC